MDACAIPYPDTLFLKADSTESKPGIRLLTTAEFQLLADMPLEMAWFVNLSNLQTDGLMKTGAGPL
jgi:hypothetical protein